MGFGNGGKPRPYNTRMESIIGALLTHANAQPNKRCVVWQGRVYTYADMRDGALAYAQHLQGLNIQRGEHIALFLENSIDFLFAYFGIGLAGGVVVLVNNTYKQTELRHILNDSAVRLVITSGTQRTEIDRIKPDLPQLRHIVDIDTDPSSLHSPNPLITSSSPLPNPEHAALIGYTSGTTGRSKGAVLLHRNLAANIASVTEAWHWSAEDHLLLMLPLFHVHGLLVGISGTIWMGASCELHRSFNAPLAYERLCSGEFSMFFGVPTMYTRLIDEAQLRRQTSEVSETSDVYPRPPALRLYVSGSAALSPQTFAEFEALFGQRILERYGMTETVMNLTNPYEGERRPGTVGQPFPKQEARIVDMRTRQPLPPDQVGEIEVRGGHVFSGYLNRPDANAESFTQDGWFKTGDLGSVSADGYYTITGRAKELIITGGYNVYPREVEEVLLACPGVAEAAVFGLPDREYGECVCAAIVRSDESLTEDEVIAFCKDQLASYKKPRRIFWLESLPRNAMGKVQKTVLSENSEATA